jgi:hypothetical protein
MRAAFAKAIMHKVNIELSSPLYAQKWGNQQSYVNSAKAKPDVLSKNLFTEDEKLKAQQIYTGRVASFLQLKRKLPVATDVSHDAVTERRKAF